MQEPNKDLQITDVLKALKESYDATRVELRDTRAALEAVKSELNRTTFNLVPSDRAKIDNTLKAIQQAEEAVKANKNVKLSLSEKHYEVFERITRESINERIDPIFNDLRGVADRTEDKIDKSQNVIQSKLDETVRKTDEALKHVVKTNEKLSRQSFYMLVGGTGFAILIAIVWVMLSLFSVPDIYATLVARLETAPWYSSVLWLVLFFVPPSLFFGSMALAIRYITKKYMESIED